MPNNQVTKLVIAILVALAIFGGYLYLNRPDHRGNAERIGDAIRELPNGADKAGDQLDDRTGAQRLGDAVRKATEK